MSAPLNNDTLATAYEIRPADGNYLDFQDNTLAVNTSPNGEPTSSPGYPLWYYWKPKPTDNGRNVLIGIAAASGTSFDSYIRIYTGPARAGDGSYPIFTQLTQVAFDDDSSRNPSVAVDGYALKASYPANNAAALFTVDSTKFYYVAAGGYSGYRNANWQLNFPQAFGVNLSGLGLGRSLISGTLSGGVIPLAFPALASQGRTTSQGSLQRVLVPDRGAVLLLAAPGPVTASGLSHSGAGRPLGTAAGAVTGPW